MSSSDFREEIVIAGFGGQGVMLAGKLLAQTAMRAGKEVTYMPSYGAEVRGGTANCMVIIADNKIACPVVGRPDSLIVMNKASLTKFGPRLKNGGLLVMNRSLIDSEPQVDDSVEIVAVPADELAVELGSHRSTNMVAVGAYLQKRGYLTPDEAAQALPDAIARRYHKTLPVNIEALHKGAEFVKIEA
ncbi:MAG: 2-oxoacid:ferredoxin oxidoreductase subunit gamma [Planctomycetes bacterium B3_Pla]|nr:MAG: 2-oxoacid:ferredoxin oxidoreductase subunit gamma [Planctomycetes bacterium B3_Pla]